MLPDDLVRTVVGAWGRDPGAIERPAAGTMNEVVIVATGAGPVVLRGHRRPDRARVELEHEVMAFARDRGVPVPAAIRRPSGNLLLERDGRIYSLFELARGRQVGRDALGPAHAAAMGEALARLHAVLAGFPPGRAPRAPAPPGADETLRGIDRLLDRLARVPDPGEHERWAEDRLRSRAAWLRRRPAAADPVVGDEQLVHGDYQDANLFFDGGAVSSIIDWDKAEVRSAAGEVVRALYLSLRLDPGLSRAFLASYRARAPLPDGRLDAAASAYGDGRARDLWLYEAIWLAGDDRPRRFLAPGPFVPFADRWAALRR